MPPSRSVLSEIHKHDIFPRRAGNKKQNYTDNYQSNISDQNYPFSNIFLRY